VEGGRPAKIVGEVSVVETPVGRAARLAGEGFLEVPNDPKLNLTAACTLATWICPKALAPGGGRIIDKSRVGTDNGYLLDTFPGNSLRLIVERGSLSHDAKFAPDAWVHVAATVDPDGTQVLYVGGKPAASVRREFPVDITRIDGQIARAFRFHERLAAAGLADTYEAAHARLAVECAAAACRRFELEAEGKLSRLPGPSQQAADKSYLSTTAKLCDGLEKVMEACRQSDDSRKKRAVEIWDAAAASDSDGGR
jgi:hypothetical protein